MTLERLKQLPKIELHCHLDGSLSRAFLQERLGRTVTDRELSVSRDCRDLAEYLEKFDLPLEALQDEEGLMGAGYDILRSMSEEQVIYAEIRFAPLLSVTGQMGTKSVIEALLRGLEKGKADFGVDYGVITCAMRHHSGEQNEEMLKAAREYLGCGVCAADLAGAEAQYPMTEFMELFQKARALEMPFTIHAGECGNAQNIADAVRVGAGRIGHGIAMRGNEAVKRLVREAGIGVEMCPTSNFQTKAVNREADYPIREFLDAGILVSVNTDNRTVSGTSMTEELELIQRLYGITDEEIRLLMRNAARTAFLSEDRKESLLRRLSV